MVGTRKKSFCVMFPLHATNRPRHPQRSPNKEAKASPVFFLWLKQESLAQLNLNSGDRKRQPGGKGLSSEVLKFTLQCMVI